MTVADKILFTCNSCEYKARIPAHYSGRSIHCPKCKALQEVGAIATAGDSAEGAPEVEAGAGSGSRSGSAPGEGKIVFTCPDCSYKGRLGVEYDGKTIRCPGCQKPQHVAGEPVASPIVASLAADETVFRTGELEKIRFECGKCGYRAKIPGKYSGKPIHCPQCKDIQQVKPETDGEASSGRTVMISKVSQAQVREAKLAMTNVGVSFACAVCGYESRISPSCAGDAVYCPSCRSPQKVEWGDPDEDLLDDDTSTAAVDQPRDDIAEKSAEAPQKTLVPERTVALEPPTKVAPPSATALSMQIVTSSSPALPMVADEPEELPAPSFSDASAESPAESPKVAQPAKIAKPARVASVAKMAPKVIAEVDADSQVDMSSPTVFADNSAPASSLADDADGIPDGARISSVQRARRSVGASSVSTDKPEKSVGKAASRSNDRTTSAPAASRPSKAPLLILLILVFLVGGACGYFFLQTQDLQTEVSGLEAQLATQKTATATEKNGRETAEAARDANLQRAETAETSLATEQETTAKLGTDIEGLQADLTARKAKIAELEAAVTKAQADLAAAQAAALEATPEAGKAKPVGK